jgi:hypothetical protein
MVFGLSPPPPRKLAKAQQNPLSFLILTVLISMGQAWQGWGHF